jgi:phage antirepressor YoqD-like protein
MNFLMTNTTVMMSSKEIAELTGKNISHVHRDIRTILEQLGNPKMDGTDFVEVLRDNGQVSEYLLNHDLTILLITGYDVNARMMVIKRWKELEGKQTTFEIPKTLSGALMLAAKQAEQIEQQQALLEQQKPMVQFVEDYVESDGTISLREAGKVLGMGQKKFIEALEGKLLYRTKAKTLAPYIHAVNDGYFVVKTGSSNDMVFTQTRVTPKGLAFLSYFLNKPVDKTLLQMQ